jgi:sugar lactone lactonase YvrE
VPPPDATPSECADPALKLPVQFTVTRASPAGDLAFDGDGFMVSFDGRDLTRVARGVRPEMLISGALPFNNTVEGMELMPDGTVMVADRQADELVRLDPRNQKRTRPIGIPQPVKVLRAPNGSLYVASVTGELFLVEPDSGRISSLARTSGRLRGLTYSVDHKVLYISDSGNRQLLSARVRPDSTIDPPAMFAKGLGIYPDGLATDICGNVFVADNNGGPLLRVTPAAKVETVSNLDGNDVAGLAFGSGKQGWDERSLYAVSDRNGALYEIKIGVRGAPPLPAGGQ